MESEIPREIRDALRNLSRLPVRRDSKTSEQQISKIPELRINRASERRIIAIDGRCGSGKTTLAQRLQTYFDCTVFHMDDFFLRPEQRTKERYQTPGGNVDYERFREEILDPLSAGALEIVWRPYDCNTQKLQSAVCESVENLIVVEGSYSCHPALWDFYDFRIFLTVKPEEQFRRIVRRNGNEKAVMFRERWIPLEELYFNAYRIEQRCDLRMELP